MQNKRTFKYTCIGMKYKLIVIAIRSPIVVDHLVIIVD